MLPRALSQSDNGLGQYVNRETELSGLALIAEVMRPALDNASRKPAFGFSACRNLRDDQS